MDLTITCRGKEYIADNEYFFDYASNFNDIIGNDPMCMF